MMNNEETEKKKRFNLEERLIDFSVLITEIVEAMPNTRAGNHYAGQLIRSGTSPALNYGEAQSGESRKDFIHKLKIAEKEANETEYWLLLCKHSKNYPFDEAEVEISLEVAA